MAYPKWATKGVSAKKNQVVHILSEQKKNWKLGVIKEILSTDKEQPTTCSVTHHDKAGKKITTIMSVRNLKLLEDDSALPPAVTASSGEGQTERSQPHRVEFSGQPEAGYNVRQLAPPADRVSSGQDAGDTSVGTDAAVHGNDPIEESELPNRVTTSETPSPSAREARAAARAGKD